MLWIGLGPEQGRALAYVHGAARGWRAVGGQPELIAERGYMTFIGKRVMYWKQLNTCEQERAEPERPGLWDEYAVEVAE